MVHNVYFVFRLIRPNLTMIIMTKELWWTSNNAHSILNLMPYFPHPKGMVHDVCVVPTLIELQEQYRHSGLLALLEQRLYFKNNSRRNFLPFPSCCRSEVRRWPEWVRRPPSQLLLRLVGTSCAILTSNFWITKRQIWNNYGTSLTQLYHNLTQLWHHRSCCCASWEPLVQCWPATFG